MIFERDEVLTGAGRPFTVFTPYKNAWLKKARRRSTSRPTRSRRYAGAARARRCEPRRADARGDRLRARRTCARCACRPACRARSALVRRTSATRIDALPRARDFPAVKGPSYLSVHLRFGTVSIRELARRRRHALGGRGAATWLSELIWRDFYFQILHHHPHVVGHAFRPELRRASRSRTTSELFAAWCEARTGYPLVDAAMRQINQTRLHAQPPAHGRRVVPGEGSASSTGAAASGTSPTTSTTSTSPPTTAAGSGRRRPAATRSRTSASSIR